MEGACVVRQMAAPSAEADVRYQGRDAGSVAPVVGRKRKGGFGVSNSSKQTVVQEIATDAKQA